MFLRTSILAPLVLALFVMAGLQGVWAVVLAVGYKTVSRALEVYPGQLRVDPQGQLVIETQRPGQIPYRTTDGRPVDVPENPYWLTMSSLAAPLSENYRDRRLTWNERLTSPAAPTQSNTRWYLVHSATSDGTGYFVGYDDLSKMPVGYISRAGFRTVEPPADQWFALAGPASRHSAWYPATAQRASGDTASQEELGRQGLVYLVADGRVWKIDLTSRTAETLSDLRNAASVAKSPIIAELPADRIPDGWPGGPYYALSSTGLLVRTPTEIIAIDLNGRRRTSWPIPQKLREADLMWYELADGGALAGELHMVEDVYWVQFQWIDLAGNVTREEELYYTPRPPASQPYWMYAALTPQVLLASLIDLVALPNQAVEHRLQPDFHTALAKALADGWAALSAVYSLSVVLAALAYRRQTRYALPGAGTWAVFVFLFGAPGWLAYRWHRHWPVLEACSECHRPAPRDRESCAACGRVFAPPPLAGTEVFA
jgi:hypothetical protein